MNSQNKIIFGMKINILVINNNNNMMKKMTKKVSRLNQSKMMNLIQILIKNQALIMKAVLPEN